MIASRLSGIALAAGIFALSQIVFHSAQPAVTKLGGTATN